MSKSKFNEEIQQLIRDASKSEIHDFEFLAVPGYEYKWHVRYSHKPQNTFSKILREIRNKPSEFIISRETYNDEVTYSAYSPLDVMHQGFSPYIDDIKDLDIFFKELRSWLGLESKN